MQQAHGTIIEHNGRPAVRIDSGEIYLLESENYLEDIGDGVLIEYAQGDQFCRILDQVRKEELDEAVQEEGELAARMLGDIETAINEGRPLSSGNATRMILALWRRLTDEDRLSLLDQLARETANGTSEEPT